MTRPLIGSAFAYCNERDCRNAVRATDSEARALGWYVFHTGSAYGLVVHYCPTHNTEPVQNSGQKEITMSGDTADVATESANRTTVTTNQVRDFVKVRDQITHVLRTQVFYQGFPIVDRDDFKETEFDDVALELMTRFNMTLVEEAEF